MQRTIKKELIVEHRKYKLARLLDEYFSMKKIGGYAVIEEFVEQAIKRALEQLGKKIINGDANLGENDKASWG